MSRTEARTQREAASPMTPSCARPRRLDKGQWAHCETISVGSSTCLLCFCVELRSEFTKLYVCLKYQTRTNEVEAVPCIHSLSSTACMQNQGLAKANAGKLNIADVRMNPYHEACGATRVCVDVRCYAPSRFATSWSERISSRDTDSLGQQQQSRVPAETACPGNLVSVTWTDREPSQVPFITVM